MPVQHPARAQRGFTLVELMIVVAIVGILSAIAYPTYTKHVAKGHRAAAQAFLMEVAQREQQFFTDSRTYKGTVADLNLSTPADVSDKYDVTITLVDGPPPGFTATATPKSGGAQAKAGEVALSIDQAGNRLPSTQW